VQAGTPQFVEELLKRQFPDAIESGIVCKLSNGEKLTMEFLEANAFSKPILVEDKDSLGFKMPDSDKIDLTKIETIVGKLFESQLNLAKNLTILIRFLAIFYC
jgi:hypothetical protein